MPTIAGLKKRVNHYLFNNIGIPVRRDEEIAKGYIKKYLPKNPVILDCGANDGWDTINLASMTKNMIYAFEPLPELFDRLTERTKSFKNIKCFPFALNDKNGWVEFHVSEGGSDASSSILPPKQHLTDHPQVLFKKTIKVESKTLDSWAEENGVSKIDFLWLDMQGFEMQMLMAAPNILKTVSGICTEVNLHESYEGTKLYPEYKEWLLSQGFKVKLEAIPHGWPLGNVFFVR